jgi:5'(3')-deoxyribonucleotidase
MKQKLLLDIDGVLTDFHSAVAKIATMGGFPVTSAEMCEWEIGTSLRRIGAPENIVDLCLNAMAFSGFNASLEPCVSALKWLPDVRRAADVMFVTSPNSKCSTWISERVAWMRKYFDVEPQDIRFASDKSTINGDLFVDDCPENVAAWQLAHPSRSALLWGRPYNKSPGLPKVCSWEDLLSKLT